MNKFLKISAAALLAAALTAPVASAQVYGDVGVGTLDLEGLDLTVLNGHIGYSVNEYFSFEGELGFGIGDDSLTSTAVDLDLDSVLFAGDVNVSYDLNNVFGVYGVLGTTLDGGLELFGRVGLVSAEVEATASANGNSASDDVSESGAAYGLGAKYYFDGVNGVRFDITRYDIEDVEADLLAIGYTRKF